jgi:hypothetical protein
VRSSGNGDAAFSWQLALKHSDSLANNVAAQISGRKAGSQRATLTNVSEFGNTSNRFHTNEAKSNKRVED